MFTQARRLTDAELVEQLRQVGIELDKASYASLAERALSVRSVFQQLFTDSVRARCQRPSDQDRVFVALAVLWERWFPQWPNFEQLDQRMQAGYAFMEAAPAAACEKWFGAWEDFLRLFEKGNFKSVRQFDEAFAGSEFVFNWVSDFETTLLNASQQEVRWHQRRIELCEQFLQRFATEDSLLTENMRRSMAEALFSLGDRGQADALFDQWLKADPQWGWGWIGWSDCYSFLAAEPERDLARAEALLKQGLAVPGVRDRRDLVDRLVELYDEQGRHEEAERLRNMMRDTRAGSASPGESNAGFAEHPGASTGDKPDDQAAAKPAPIPQPRKVGRNEPCPCGSGKKYKKCCLPKDEARARAAAAAARQAEEQAASAHASLPSDRPPPQPAEPQIQPRLTLDRFDEPKLPPEVEARLTALWDEFEEIEEPTGSQMDQLLSQLLELPFEATEWNDLLHLFAQCGHPDLPSVFRRIASTVPHTKDTDLAFFYWAAAEEFFRRNLHQMLPEVASGFRKT